MASVGCDWSYREIAGALSAMAVTVFRQKKYAANPIPILMGCMQFDLRSFCEGSKFQPHQGRGAGPSP
jgi:hypothetical protein